MNTEEGNERNVEQNPDLIFSVFFFLPIRMGKMRSLLSQEDCLKICAKWDFNNCYDCADYLKYKCEGAINILHVSSPICNIPAKSIDQADEVFSTVTGDFEGNPTEQTINFGPL